MQTGPQIECRGCTMPILLVFTVADGPLRALRCPMCAHDHEWSIAAGDEHRGRDRAALRSSVE